jgi:hypothetical protein
MGQSGQVARSSHGEDEAGLLVRANPALGRHRPPNQLPGPLEAFYARIAFRRGHAIAIVVVARKLAGLAWHFLTHDVEYRWAPARFTATKMRAIELAARAITVGSDPRSGDSRQQTKIERQLSRLVGRRTRSPPNGERLG